MEPISVDPPVVESSGRPHRQSRRLPLRYRVEQPAQLLSLPPPGVIDVVPQSPPLNSQGSKRHVLKSPYNKFGLFRQYYAVDYPTHDPDAEAKLSDVPNSAKSGFSSATLFRPYPNKNAFLLGEWYWNSGIQNSKESFKQLINIVSNQSFDPADVRNIRWDSLNKNLGESSNPDDIWLDEPDAGWTEAKITLSIPFQKIHQIQVLSYIPFHHFIIEILSQC